MRPCITQKTTLELCADVCSSSLVLSFYWLARWRASTTTTTTSSVMVACVLRMNSLAILITMWKARILHTVLFRSIYSWLECWCAFILYVYFPSYTYSSIKVVWPFVLFSPAISLRKGNFLSILNASSQSTYSMQAVTMKDGTSCRVGYICRYINNKIGPTRICELKTFNMSTLLRAKPEKPCGWMDPRKRKKEFQRTSKSFQLHTPKLHAVLYSPLIYLSWVLHLYE